MRSATEHPQLLDQYVCQESSTGRILGPFQASVAPTVYISQVRVIPKNRQQGKWRVITDLSFPEGYSVNDAIDPKLCSLQHLTVDQVAAVAMTLGRGSLLALRHTSLPSRSQVARHSMAGAGVH